MPTVAEMIKYRNQFVADFQIGMPLLADRFTEETMTAGKSAVFDIHAISGRMSKRSIDGRIPRRERSASQVTIPLEEFVDKEEITSFEKFISQSDERAKINRSLNTRAYDEMDFIVLNALADATTEYGASATAMTHGVVTNAIATIAANKVPVGAQDLTWITSTFGEAKLQNITAYTSADYVATKPLETGGNQFSRERKIKNWCGAGWIVHPNLPGAGTSSCTNYIVHRRALGLAKPSDAMKYEAGPIPGELADYAVCGLVMAAGVLQQVGIMKVYINDAA